MECYNLSPHTYKRCFKPWMHWEISNFFTQEALDNIYKIMDHGDFLHAHDPSVHHAWTKNTNRYEYMFSRERYEKDIFVREMIDQFKSDDNIEFLEFLVKKKLRGNHMLRMSIWRDEPGYQLGIHPDSTYKLLTAQIYFPHDQVAEKHLGTSMYDQDKKEEKRVEFKKNCGYMFSPSHDDGCTTYHGLEGTVDITRYSFMINIFDRLLFESKINSKDGEFPVKNAWHEL